MQPQMAIAQPINDQQLLILVAAMSPGDTPKAKLQFASELWAECLMAGLSLADAYVAEHNPEYIEARKAQMAAQKRSNLVVPGPGAPLDFLKERNRKA